MSDIGCAGAVFVLKSCAYAIGITVLSFDMGEAIICRWGNVTFSHNLLEIRACKHKKRGLNEYVKTSYW